MPHDQARVDALSRTMMELSEPISEAEFRRLSEAGGAVMFMMIAHEGWCSTMQTGKPEDCTCQPTTIYRRCTV